MHIIHNKFFIVLSILILLLGVYTYFSNNLDVQAATPTPQNSPLSSTSNSPNIDSPISPNNDKISKDTAFLATLTSLNKLHIDTSIFSSQSFNLLKDNTVILEPAVPGRPNPFAPINSENSTIIETPVSTVTTNEPTEITNKSALLNGTVDGSLTGITSTYFEYGPTETLGSVTPAAKQSLVGTFFTSITGLKSKTKYYFSAVAKINGSLNYGEIITFTTN